MPEPTHSYALLNIMVGPEGFLRSLPRIPIKRSVKSIQVFTCHFYAGYDFCPDLLSDEIIIQFHVRFGEFEYTSKNPVLAKSPIWNLKLTAHLFLDENLEFASNINISFVNIHPSQKNKLFGDNKVGEINIQAFHIGNPEEYDKASPLEP